METENIVRREFLHHTAAGTATLAALGAGAAEQPTSSAGACGSIKTEADVLVVGGGTAGTIAALQAARAGARTVLVERGSQLGGTMTVGGIAFPGLFHAWGRQIIAGIGWELVKEAAELDGAPMPDFATVPSRHWQHQVQINQFLYAALAEEKCAAAGVSLAYYEFPLAIESTPDGWLVECVGPGTRRFVACRQLIDCTGGGDVVGMLGLPRLREKETQPGSMLFKMGGTYQPGREQLQAVYVHGADSSTSVTRTAANLTGRRQVLAQLRQKLKRSGGKTRLMQMQPEAAMRESYRIQGETIITHDDYRSGRVFDDAVCYAFYPIDLHTRTGVRPKPLASGTVPTVPLRALVPKGSRNICVAGRCVSSDRLANSALRVQGSCMAMGQAAGAAAALAAGTTGSTPLDVPVDDVRRLLRENQAIVPEI